MKQVLVWGGSGFIGGHACEKLVRAGYRVTVTTRKAAHARNVMHLPGLTVLECDVRDEQSLGRVMAGMDVVVNLIAILHGSAQAYVSTHQDLPATIARVCAKQGVRQLVHVSALGVDSRDPQSAPSQYLRSKALGEIALAECLGFTNLVDQTQRCGLTILRPSVVFGANDRFLNVFAQLQAAFPFMPLACSQAQFQPIWVEDVATAIVRSLELGARQAPAMQVYELAGPQIYTLRELVQFAARCSGINHGRGRPVIGLPLWMGYLQAAALGLVPGEPLMSADNLRSMQKPNIANGDFPGLDALGIEASPLEAIGPQYLQGEPANHGLLGLRHRHR